MESTPMRTSSLTQAGSNTVSSSSGFRKSIYIFTTGRREKVLSSIALHSCHSGLQETNNHPNSVNYHPKLFRRLKEVLIKEGRWTN